MLSRLIVVVPGIGGSVLAGEDGKVVWGTTSKLVGLVRHPECLSLDAPRLRAVGVLETVGYFPPFQVPGYEHLINGLVNGLGVRGLVVDVAVDGRDRNLVADIVVLAYDFRLGVEPAAERLAAEVDARVGHLSEREQAGRVVVVGHSMGGLVGRRWLVDPVEAKRCMALITVGTPHRGATKALDWLVNGASVGGGLRIGARPAVASSRTLFAGMSDVIRGWPGVYDLLPTYRVIDDLDTGSRVTPLDLAGPAGPGFAADPAFGRHARRASALHGEISNAWSGRERGTAPSTIPFFARDHGTLHRARLAGGVLTVASADPEWQVNEGWRGDGTVPALSAIPAELGRPEDGDRRHHVLERHVPMAGAGAVVQMVRDLVGQDMSAVRGTGGPPTRIRLGVDMDDACLLGEPTTVTCRLLADADVAPEDVTVWLTVGPEDGSAQPFRLPAERLGDSWRGELTLPGPGLWRVTVQAVRAEGDEPPTVTDTIAVLDPEAPVLVGGPGGVRLS